MLRRSQSGDNRIQLKEIQRVLANIGVSDEQFSSSDLNEVFAGKEAVDVNVLVKYLQISLFGCVKMRYSIEHFLGWNFSDNTNNIINRNRFI